MSKILLDWNPALRPEAAMSIELEKVDIERGYMLMPTPFPLGKLIQLPLSDFARVGDVIHIPTPYRIGDDRTPLQERDDDSQENGKKDQ